ncbi:hypothetical protein FRC06_010924, partial [Ceratobasidium sp. 370]
MSSNNAQPAPLGSCRKRPLVIDESTDPDPPCKTKKCKPTPKNGGQEIWSEFHRNRVRREKLESDAAYREGYAAGVSTVKRKAQQEEERFRGVVAPPSHVVGAEHEVDHKTKCKILGSKIAEDKAYRDGYEVGFTQEFEARPPRRAVIVRRF